MLLEDNQSTFPSECSEEALLKCIVVLQICCSSDSLPMQKCDTCVHVLSICTVILQKLKVGVAIDNLLLLCLANDPVMKLNEVTCNIATYNQ